MKNELINLILDKEQKRKLSVNEQISWLSKNYNLEIDNKKEIRNYLEKNDYLLLSINYLETLREIKINDLSSSKLFEFIDLDNKINFNALLYILKIRDKTFDILVRLKIIKLQKNFGNQKNFKDIIKSLTSLEPFQIKRFLNEYQLEEEYFNPFIIHLENLEFLRREILEKNSTIFSMKDDNVNYDSLYEYINLCAKFLLDKSESFAQKLYIKEMINNSKLDKNLKSEYKKIFGFISWDQS